MRTIIAGLLYLEMEYLQKHGVSKKERENGSINTCTLNCG